MTAVAEQPLSDVRREAQLGQRVPQSLRRKPLRKASWGVWRVTLAGVATLGVLPLVKLSRKFRMYVRHEQQQLSHLAELIVLQTRSDDAQRLVRVARRVTPSRGIGIVIGGCVVAGIVGGGGALASGPMDLQAIGELVSRAPRRGEVYKLIAWAASAVGFFAHGWQINRQALRVQRFNNAIGFLAQRYQVNMPRGPGVELGLSPGWLGMGVVLMILGLLWTLPMLLAGAAHRRYITRSSVRYRRQLAELADQLSAKTEKGGWTAPAGQGLPCPETRCRGVIPRDAGFCPRCGTAAL